MRSAARDPAAVRGWSKSRGYWDRWSLHTLCPQQPWACLIALLPLALVVSSMDSRVFAILDPDTVRPSSQHFASGPGSPRRELWKAGSEA